MPKAYIGYIGECFTEHFHSLTMANQLHSHVSQGLFSLLVKLNDLATTPIACIQLCNEVCFCPSNSRPDSPGLLYKRSQALTHLIPR